MKLSLKLGLVLIALALGEARPVRAALRDGGNGFSGPQLDVRSLNVSCAYAQNDTATLRRELETGAAVGKTLFLPSGCKVLLGTPGSDDFVAEWPSDTTIECEDGTAGFVLARKACSDSSDTPGAACTADNQCKSGTCDPDYQTGGSFAPDASLTYGVFGAAVGTKNLTLRNCGIWVNQGSGDPPAMGGAGKRWGWCDGAGTSIAGEGCFNACNSSSGAFEGFACLANTDCNAGGACSPGSCTARAGNCKSLGGSCTAIPYATNWAASGPGKVNVIAWGNVTNARVENVTIYDHRRGDASIEVGPNSVVIDSTNKGDTLQQNQAAGQIFGAQLYASSFQVDGAVKPAGPVTCGSDDGSRCFAPTVVKGVVLGSKAAADRVVGFGWTAGVHGKGGNIITDTAGGGYGDASQPGWTGNAGLLVSSGGVKATGFTGGTSLYCVLPEFASGFNFTISNPYCDGNVGPKFIINGSGNQFSNLRGAWHGRGAIFGLGDQRGLCGSGTRSGKVCLFGAGDDATIGCPTGASCVANDAFPAGSANHFVISGGLLFSEEGSEVAYLRATDSKRCVNSAATDYGGPCTVDADCSTGSCDYLTWTNATISGVLDYNGGAATALDLSTSGVGWSVTADSPSISNWNVSGIDVHGFATGFKFPSLSRVCLGGSNDGTSCTADATCTGSGKCRGQVEDFFASGAFVGVTTPLSNWDWGMGDVSGMAGLLPTDDQCKPVSFFAGAALTRGQLVSASTSADATVVVTTTSNPERGFGVVLGTTLSGYAARICTSGVAACIADGTIARGDQLKPSGSTAGRVVAVSGNSDLIVAKALAGATSGQTFDCLVTGGATIQNTTAGFPKFDGSDANSLTGLTSSCATNSQLALVSGYTATSGRKIRLLAVVPINQTTSATRDVTVTIKRGGSSCDAGSPTTLVTGTGTVSNGVKMSVVTAIADTGQSGSVTYRVCGCSNGAGTQADAGSALHLTEY